MTAARAPLPPDDEVAALLARRFGAAPGSVVPLGAGEWSRAWAFRRGGSDLVLRLGHHPEDFAKDRLAAALAAPALPVPAVIETGEAAGAWYAISERVDGEFLERLDGPALRRLLPSLLGLLGALRDARLPGSRGFGRWDASGNAPFADWDAALRDVARDAPGSRTAGWRARLEASPVGAAPFDRALAVLEPAGPPVARHVIHGDLVNRNVLVTGDRVAGVIDWGSAMHGDHLYDLAWLAFWAPWSPGWSEVDLVAEARRHAAAGGIAEPHVEERLRRCLVHIGLDAQAYVAFSGRDAELPWLAARTLAFAGLAP